MGTVARMAAGFLDSDPALWSASCVTLDMLVDPGSQFPICRIAPRREIEYGLTQLA